MQELRTATVAACTGVVGKALVEQLLGNGTRVVGFVREGAERDAAALFGSTNGKLTLFGGDMANPKHCEILVASASGALGGRIDAHFHAAGSFEWVTWEDVSPATVETLWTSNYTTAWALGREVFRTMKASGGGNLVYVSARDSAARAPKGMGPYLAAKAALNMLVQSMAAEGAAYGIRVNAVLPTIIDTEVNRNAMPDQDPGNWVSPVRLAKLMIDLARPEHTDVSGALIPVPGKLF